MGLRKSSGGRDRERTVDELVRRPGTRSRLVLEVCGRARASSAEESTRNNKNAFSH